jgi:hypothetical protein
MIVNIPGKGKTTQQGARLATAVQHDGTVRNNKLRRDKTLWW